MIGADDVLRRLASGERFVPEVQAGEPLAAGHLARYEFARSQIRHGESVLDLACGVGYGAQMLSAAGGLVTGVDRDNDAVAYARHATGGNVVYACRDFFDDAPDVIPVPGTVKSLNSAWHRHSFGHGTDRSGRAANRLVGVDSPVCTCRNKLDRNGLGLYRPVVPDHVGVFPAVVDDAHPHGVLLRRARVLISFIGGQGPGGDDDEAVTGVRVPTCAATLRPRVALQI
jgi:SAM-dependent methyltransferase